jgi:hypothetical protein
MQRRGIVPAPAYRLGWSRFSCLTCIFGSADQWATIRYIAPDRFGRIAADEQRFGCTIHLGRTITDLADRGRPYPATIAQPALVRQALSPDWLEPVTVPPAQWQMPAGAYGEAVGPG